MKKIKFTILGLMFLPTLLMAQEKSTTDKNMIEKVTKTDDEWQEILSPREFFVLRLKGTDKPGPDGYTNHFEKGTYHCAACDLQLFESGSKYQSHCGWPSFDDSIEGTVNYKLDKSHGMIRTEILCARCDGHLGHVFNDGPEETTGLRYCVNTTSLKFVKEKKGAGKKSKGKE